jgi:hypothetical protein
MDKAALGELIKWKEAESVHYTRHLFGMAVRTHAEIVAFCNRTVHYPFDLERNAASFVLLAGGVYNNLLNIMTKVKPEIEQVRAAWKAQVLGKRAIKALVDRRDGLSHGRLDRWLLKSDGGVAKTEDDKYPHMPVLTIREGGTLIFFQWNDKYRAEFEDCLAWQEEVLQELHHQEHNYNEILQKLRSGGNLTDVVRRQLLLPIWNVEQT